MCYRLYLASPLTLSEVRSMLPTGASVDLAPPPIRDALLTRHRPAKTALELKRGGCACDLIGLPAAADREEERELRARYRRLGVSRSDVIRAIDNHRQPRPQTVYPVDWPVALAGFVAEHARNAGPALYHLKFEIEPTGTTPGPDSTDAPPVTAAMVRASPTTWLREGDATMVIP